MPLKDRLPVQYKFFSKSINLYWKNYGGWKALLGSPYFHFAVLLTILLYPFRISDGSSWFDITFSVLPNILGFTLGGYAILLAFGDEKFRNLISGEDGEGKPSPFMSVNGTFVHFILIQTFAILYAAIGKAWAFKVGWFAFMGLFLFLYSISIAVASAFSILKLSKSFDDYQTEKNKQAKKNKVKNSDCNASDAPS